MKRLLFAILLMAGCARADELQLDHSFGAAQATQGLAFSPDATKLAVAGSDGVKIYETATGLVLETKPASGFFTSSVAWSPDGKSLAAGGRSLKSTRSGDIWIWNAGQKPLHWTTGRAAIDSLAWSPDGRTLASAGGTAVYEEGDAPGSACLWDAADGKLKRTLGHYAPSYSSIAFSADGKVVAFSGTLARGDGAVYSTLCDAQTGRVLKTWDKGGGPVIFNGRTPLFDQSLLARGVKNGFEYEVKISPAPENQTFFSARKIGSNQALTRMPLEGMGLGIALGGDYLAQQVYMRSNLGTSSTIALWKISGDPPKADLVRRMGGRTLATSQLAASGDGKTFALACSNGTAIFDANFGPPRILPPWRVSELVPVSSPQLSLSWNGSRLYDGRWLDLKPTLPTEVLPTRAVYNDQEKQLALSPDGTVLGSGARLQSDSKPEKTLTLPDTDEFNDREIRQSKVAWSADGKHLVVVGSQNSTGQLFLFDSNGKYQRKLSPSDYSTQWHSAAISPDDGHIAAVGISEPMGKAGQTVLLRLWDMATTRQERQIEVLTNSFGSASLDCGLAFSPDSHVVAASGSNPSGQTLSFFNVQSGAKIGMLPLRSRVEKSWVFLDSRRVAILNGNAIDVWDFRAHRLEKSEFMVPKPGGFDFVERH